jgi:hypothetical protein
MAVQPLLEELAVKVGKSQKQFFLPSILQENERKFLPNSSLASKMNQKKSTPIYELVIQFFFI